MIGQSAEALNKLNFLFKQIGNLISIKYLRIQS